MLKGCGTDTTDSEDVIHCYTPVPGAFACLGELGNHSLPKSHSSGARAPTVPPGSPVLLGVGVLAAAGATEGEEE